MVECNQDNFPLLSTKIIYRGCLQSHPSGSPTTFHACSYFNTFCISLSFAFVYVWEISLNVLLFTKFSLRCFLPRQFFNTYLIWLSQSSRLGAGAFHRWVRSIARIVRLPKRLRVRCALFSDCFTAALTTPRVPTEFHMFCLRERFQRFLNLTMAASFHGRPFLAWVGCQAP